MSASIRRTLAGLLVCGLVGLWCGAAPDAAGAKVAASSKTSIARNFGNLPLTFEPNQGQSDPRVKFISRAHNETLFLTQRGATIALTRAQVPDYHSLASFGGAANGIKKATFRAPSPRVESSSVRMEFVGASGAAKIEGIDRVAGVTNYFVGSNPKNWHAGIPNYAKVRYTGLYRGIDLVFYGGASRFEYDLIIAAGVDPHEVKIRFTGAEKLAIDKSGDLALALGGDHVVLRKPFVYQERGGNRAQIDGRYVLLDRDTVVFEVGRYDRNRALVIDPSLTWAKILPGNFLDITNAVATDSSSNPYVTGFTCSSDFGVKNGPTSTAGAQAGCDTFVTKLNANSGTVAYTSIFGGSSFEQGFGIAVDGTGAAYVTGQTFSNDFSDAAGQLAPTAAYDAFVAKLDPNGHLLWARLLGGSNPTANFLGLGWSIGFSVAIPVGCNDTCPAYVVGQTTVNDFPVTSGAVQNTSLNLFDAFLTEIDPSGNNVVYSTYFSGGPDPRNVGAAAWAYGVAVDAAGQAYLDGGSHIASLPTTGGFTDTHASWSGGGDCWAAKIDANPNSGSPLVYARFLGGSDHDECRAIAIDPGCMGSCSAYLTGFTWSSDFPHTAKAYQQSFGGFEDAFVTKLDSGGNIMYSTFLGNITGEGGNSIAVDTAGEAYVTGTTGNFFPQFNAVQGAIPLNGSVLKSTDGGVTFGATGFPTSAGSVSLNGIGIDPFTPTTTYVASFETGVQRSVNSGQNFSTFSTGNILGVVHDPNDPTIFYGGGFNGLFKSVDSGTTFNIATSLTGEVTWVALDTSTSPSSVYAATSVSARTSNPIGHVYKSADGINFTQMPGLSATTIFSLALDPTDGTLYAGTSRGLYRTSSFAPTGSMTTPREWMPAALLQDGTVLVPGGFRNFNNPPLNSTDLYDPSSGTFSGTGSLQTPRAFLSATTLPSNGKVLIAGGTDGTHNLTSAELYDPVARTFSYTGSMTHARTGHTATLLNDSTVVIISDCCAERYDPVLQTFSPAGNMVTPRDAHTATLITTGVNAGKVLIAGGVANSGGSTLASAELYDPSSNSFTNTGSMAYPRNGHVAASLPDGRILVAGGETGNYPGAPVLPAEIYDPASGMFSTTASLDVPRVGASAVTLPSGRIIILSGNDPTHLSNTATTVIYDENTQKFTPGGLMNTWRNGFPAVLLPSGKVFMTGANRGPNLDGDQTAELYDPNSFGFQLSAYRSDPVFAVAVDPTTNPSTVYAAVPQGVAKSSDGFSDFGFVDFLGGGIFYSLALDSSTTPAKLYAGDGNGELLSSTDAGNHVLVQNIHGSKPGNVSAVATTSDGSGTVYASVTDEFDAFVSKLDMNGQNLLFSSFIGGSQGDFSNGIAVAPDGSAYATGGTASGDFNSAAGELKGRDNPFIAKIPNTLAGSGQTDCISQGTCITFPTVVSGGNTVAQTSAVGPQLPPGLSLVSNSGFTNITTTATIMASDSSPITVCFTYDPAQVSNPANLSLMHFENNQWINVTTQVDTTAHIICGGVTSLSPFAVVVGKPVTVTIEIKPPSSAPVPINLGSNGLTPVAILSTSTFDATKVIPSSIVIDGAAVRLKGKGTYQCSAQDVNGDGRKDLVCQVSTNQIDLIPGSDMAILTATTTSGTPIQGQEAISVVK